MTPALIPLPPPTASPFSSNAVIRLEENSNWHSWVLERRPDGAILVRVPSSDRNGRDRLPDAVFSFRDGDPQYTLWAERLASREATSR